jgi:hypothetical protein
VPDRVLLASTDAWAGDGARLAPTDAWAGDGARLAPTDAWAGDGARLASMGGGVAMVLGWHRECWRARDSRQPKARASRHAPG